MSNPAAGWESDVADCPEYQPPAMTADFPESFAINTPDLGPDGNVVLRKVLQQNDHFVAGIWIEHLNSANGCVQTGSIRTSKQ